MSGGGAAGAPVRGVYNAAGCRGGRPYYARNSTATADAAALASGNASAAAANASAAPDAPAFLVFSSYWGDWDFASAPELSDDNTLGYGGEGDGERRPELVPSRDWYLRDDAAGEFLEAPGLAVHCLDTCNDGRWNFDEEGVDCGGESCPPCADVYGAPPPSISIDEAEAAALAAEEAVAAAQAAVEQAAAAAMAAAQAAADHKAALDKADAGKAEAAKKLHEEHEARARDAAAAHAAATAAADAAAAEAAEAQRAADMSRDLAALRSKLEAEQRVKDDVAREEAVAHVAVVGVVIIGACIVMGGPLLFYLKKGHTGGGIGGAFVGAGGGSGGLMRGAPGGKRRPGV